MPQYLHGPVYVCALHGSAELWTPIMSVSTLPALVTVRIIQTSSELHQPKEPYSNNGLLQKIYIYANHDEVCFQKTILFKHVFPNIHEVMQNIV